MVPSEQVATAVARYGDVPGVAPHVPLQGCVKAVRKRKPLTEVLAPQGRGARGSYWWHALVQKESFAVVGRRWLFRGNGCLFSGPYVSNQTRDKTVCPNGGSVGSVVKFVNDLELMIWRNIGKK